MPSAKSFRASEIADILDNIGLPYSGFNMAFTDSVTLGSFDGEILVSLKPGHHGPTWDYVREMRRKLAREFPDLTFFFQPADIVGQILNFGLPAPIDVQVVGPLKQCSDKNYAHRAGDFAPPDEDSRRRRRARASGERRAADAASNVDRARASQMGCQQKDVANDMLISLSSSGAGVAQLVGESGQRRRLSGGGADAQRIKWIRQRR